MAGIERVEVMVLKRILRWLGHVELMDDTRIPKCLLGCCPLVSKHSAGGQKRRWNNVILADLNKRDLLTDWREVAYERGAWRSLVKEAAAEFNRSLEANETQSKEERKQRREDGVQPGSLALSRSYNIP